MATTRCVGIDALVPAVQCNVQCRVVRTRVPLQVERPGVELVGADEAARLGYSLSLLGLTVLNVAIKAMKEALGEIAAGGHPSDAQRLPFEELYAEVGFREHYAWEERFDEGSASRGASTAPASGEAAPLESRKRKAEGPS